MDRKSEIEGYEVLRKVRLGYRRLAVFWLVAMTFTFSFAIVFVTLGFIV